MKPAEPHHLREVLVFGKAQPGYASNGELLEIPTASVGRSSVDPLSEREALVALLGFNVRQQQNTRQFLCGVRLAGDLREGDVWGGAGA